MNTWDVKHYNIYDLFIPAKLQLITRRLINVGEYQTWQFLMTSLNVFPFLVVRPYEEPFAEAFTIHFTFSFIIFNPCKTDCISVGHEIIK